MACAPSDDSDQPGHPPSLIRVFAVRMKKAWVLSYALRAQRRLIRLDGCPGWSVSPLSAEPFCWFCDEAAQIGNERIKVARNEKFTKHKWVKTFDFTQVCRTSNVGLLSWQTLQIQFAAASVQGLYCLHTGCSIRNKVRIKNYTPTPDTP